MKAKRKSGELQEEGHACTVNDVQEKNRTRSSRQGIFSSFLPSDLTILIHTPRTGRLYCIRTYTVSIQYRHFSQTENLADNLTPL